MRPLVVVLALTSLSACVSVQPHTIATPEGRTFVNARAERQAATLRLRDGRAVRAHALRVSGDSLSWLDPATGAVGQAASAEVASVAFSTRRHALRNTALGLAVGAATGYLAGHANPEFFMSAHQTGTFGAVFYGLLGAGAGALTGIDRSNRDVYRNPLGRQGDQGR